PTIELHDANGGLLNANDSWKSSQQTDIAATGIAPTNDREAAILATLPAGAYTAVMRGANNTTGVGVIDAYQIVH
ncbi:MAG: hypothetical protein M3Z64_08790, partial [Verrucomicrobiota bacterium]|nr:hypothetical protein [Verrucomicrobiota bacterium]